ncbi:hypothetical protein BH09ACT10_BH09ACT10_00270 [soil metagenome]
MGSIWFVLINRDAGTPPPAAGARLIQTPSPPTKSAANSGNRTSRAPQIPRPAAVAPVVPDRASGIFEAAAGTSARVGRGHLVTYRVEVEDGLPIEPSAFAAAVDGTLADPRGWTSAGEYSFKRSPRAVLRILLASPSTTDNLCAPLKTRGEVSCRNGNVVAINAKRWFVGALSYGNDLGPYRQYVVNHEVGHSLGRRHQDCPKQGALAPVMLQQTIGLQGCKANSWPYR